MADGSTHRRRLDDPVAAERDIAARLDRAGLEVDYDALSVVSNVYRAATAIRRHMERTVLAAERLSWTAFVALWVLWVWDGMESRHLAVEAGVSKGTLTGVLDTLERRGLVRRRRQEDDRRLVTVTLTVEGDALITRLYPAFNAEETRLTGSVAAEHRAVVAAGLRDLVRGVDVAAEPPLTRPGAGTDG